jgi:hypothetical protein
MIQIQPETHQLLKEYCNEHGYKISAIVDKIIKKHIEPQPTIVEVKQNNKTKTKK